MLNELFGSNETIFNRSIVSLMNENVFPTKLIFSAPSLNEIYRFILYFILPRYTSN